NDGRVLTINGRTYSKGLGVHANSEIVYDLGGNCSLFTSDIGVDAESGRRGSIVFQVLADGVSLFRSGTMVGNTGPQSVSVNLTGRKQLTLKVTSGGDGIDSDKGDWANAQLACGTDEPAPTITGVSPVLSTPAALSSVFSATF